MGFRLNRSHSPSPKVPPNGISKVPRVWLIRQTMPRKSPLQKKTTASAIIWDGSFASQTRHSSTSNKGFCTATGAATFTDALRQL